MSDIRRMNYTEKSIVAEELLSEIFKQMTAAGATSFSIKMFAFPPTEKKADGTYVALPQFEVKAENETVRNETERFFKNKDWDSEIINIMLRKSVSHKTEGGFTIEHHYSTECDVMCDREEYCILSRCI